MIYHPLLALSKVQGLTEVFIVGFYEDGVSVLRCPELGIDVCYISGVFRLLPGAGAE